MLILGPPTVLVFAIWVHLFRKVLTDSSHCSRIYIGEFVFIGSATGFEAASNFVINNSVFATLFLVLEEYGEMVGVWLILSGLGFNFIGELLVGEREALNSLSESEIQLQNHPARRRIGKSPFYSQ